MVRAILKKGKIRPLDTLPESWEEGQELIIEEVETNLRKIKAIPDEDPRLKALRETERESKEQAEGEMEKREKEERVMAELAAWREVYSGLSEEEIEEVEAIALDRSRFFREEPE